MRSLRRQTIAVTPHIGSGREYSSFLSITSVNVSGLCRKLTKANNSAPGHKTPAGIGFHMRRLYLLVAGAFFLNGCAPASRPAADPGILLAEIQRTCWIIDSPAGGTLQPPPRFLRIHTNRRPRSKAPAPLRAARYWSLAGRK